MFIQQACYKLPNTNYLDKWLTMHCDIFFLEFRNVEKLLSAHMFCLSGLVILQIINKDFTRCLGNTLHNDEDFG